jgi:hypothetical protein
MIWWSLIVVCYAANLRDTSLSLVELKDTTETPDKITLFTPSGGQHRVEVTPYWSVEKLKEKVEQLTAIPIDQQRLLYYGEELLDGKIMQNYGIGNGSNISIEVK